MKRIKDGILYDTEKATLVYVGEWRPRYYADEHYDKNPSRDVTLEKRWKSRDTLYMSEDGHYFYVQENVNVTITPLKFDIFGRKKPAIPQRENDWYEI